MSDEYIKKSNAIAYCNKKANYYADKAERYKKHQEHGSYFDLANRIQSYETEATFYSSFSKELESLPLADVVERKRGKWIEAREYDPCYWICSECKRQVDIQENFCPNCGADMRGIDDE